VKRLLLAAALLALLGGAVQAAEHRPVTPGGRDRCPVCGMFVAKYPDFLAQVIYRDGAYALFDGAKDMFKYLFNPRVYAPSRKASEIGAIYVTDYYSLTPIDGKAAWYVLDSDVLGPMGRELIPFRSETEAKEFMADHKGRRLLRFAEVTADVLKGLD
jgi:nitrous oxide reductase accessory protein NosL